MDARVGNYIVIVINDELLTQTLKETGHLMDFLKDDDFLREATAFETECGEAVEVGLGLKNYVAQGMAAGVLQMAQLEALPPIAV